MNSLHQILTVRRAAIGVVLIALGLFGVARSRPELGEVASLKGPRQTALAEPVDLAAPEGFSIHGTDRYELEALVVSRRRYRFDGEAELSPVDFYLAWGPVTLQPNIDAIRFSQGGRWGEYRYKLGSVSIVDVEINAHLANTHIIPEPGNPELGRGLLAVRRGDVVRLSGYLVRVEGPEGFQWKSSRTRRDFGNHACEVFYVTEMN